jgi:hypothetical protein
MNKSVAGFLKILGSAARDLTPIILVIAFFQTIVLQQPFPDVSNVLVGLVCVAFGLALFVQGLEMGLFPIGEAMAQAMARKGSLSILLVFAFALGFGTTVAEPALIAVAGEAAAIAFWLRLTVALSVGVALVLGVFRILAGWPIQYLIIGGYVLVILITTIAPPEIIGIAYDSGGVTTSTITVPLVTALGVGLASAIKGRNPMLDGFGLIALASLMPIIFVMIFGMLA